MTFTINFQGKEESFTDVMKAAARQTELRRNNISSDLWKGDDELIRSTWKNDSNGNWVVMTPVTEFEIVVETE